jgi:hypothetical protein
MIIGKNTNKYYDIYNSIFYFSIGIRYWKMDYGALLSPKLDTDIIYENKGYDSGGGILNLPEEYVLTTNVITPRNQNRRGTCAAFVGSTMIEYKTDADAYLSPEFLYHHRITKPAGGMYGRDIFHILMRQGCVPENLYSYLTKDNESIPPNAKLYDVASKYKINGYARILTVLGLKVALLSNESAYLLLPAYHKGNNFWIPNNTTDPSICHAITVMGYNETGFLFKNSWGEFWGNNGYGLINYEDWEKYLLECWVMVGAKWKVSATRDHKNAFFASIPKFKRKYRSKCKSI